MDEPLSDYLDRLIRVAYVRVERGVGYRSSIPNEESVMNYIEHPSSGRPVPIDDSVDHFLLRSFDRCRREYMLAPVPEYHRYSQLPVSGEIPWRVMHHESGRADSVVLAKDEEDVER